MRQQAGEPPVQWWQGMGGGMERVAGRHKEGKGKGKVTGRQAAGEGSEQEAGREVVSQV